MQSRRPILTAVLLAGVAPAGAVAQQSTLQLNASSKQLAPSVFTLTAPLPAGLTSTPATANSVVLSRRSAACTTRVIVQASAGRTTSSVSVPDVVAKLRIAAARTRKRNPGVIAHVTTPVLPFATSAGGLSNVAAANPVVESTAPRGLTFPSGKARLRVQFAASLVAALDPPNTPGQRGFSLIIVALASKHSASCAGQAARLGSQADATIIAGARLTQS